MLASITPLGERGRNGSWGLTTSFYLVGSVVGGAAIGALAGAVGWMLLFVARPPSAAVLAIVLVLVVATAAMDLGLLPLRLPSVRRQVDRTWLDRYRGWVYGLGFGLQLGLGVTTIISTASVYLVIAIALLSGSPVPGALIGASFGLARGLPQLATKHVTTFERLNRLHRAAEEWSHRGNTASVAALGLIAAAVAITVYHR